MSEHDEIEGIAVIGMSGRFPKARNVGEFWRNLVDGVESLSFPTDEELLGHGIDPAELSLPNYVKAGCFLEDIDFFDAAFFGISPKEAELMDPQHRVFLETAYEALEDAGYDPAQYDGEVGVYAGCSLSTYMLFNLNYQLSRAYSLPLVLGNDKDYLSTRVSYKLDLKGPSVAVQSACSTSLVAVSLACEALLDYQCNMALAGGIATRAPRKMGYVYEQGGILSPDGHCRAFDAKAQGTIFGSGVGVVVLKRLADAIADGDNVRAVVLGSAINNDGSAKVGYTAPGVDGQVRVIAMAQAMANVSPDTITYVETHGTGTALGDPIEVAALTKAFRAGTKRKGFCAIGSVKTNVGHLDTAAGVTGFIKTVLALENRLIPASLNFETPNPAIDFENSPFYVNDRLSEWTTDGDPRRAGVSAFGIGGTNAHVVVEEAPPPEPSEGTRSSHLFVLSARTPTALDAVTANLASRLHAAEQLEPGNVAFTLGVGRRALSSRRAFVAASLDEAVELLEAPDSKRVLTRTREVEDVPVAFMFTGQGAQYAGMTRGIYEAEPTFREHVDRCCETLRSHLGFDLRTALFPEEGAEEAAGARLRQTWITQPALFVVEYALAKLLGEWGVEPKAMIGHSIGEYVAACLAGVFSEEDALSLVAARGRLMQELAPGSMLAVSLPEDRVREGLDAGLSLAAVNAPTLCVVSGPTPAVEAYRAKLEASGVECRALHTSHAFHSAMMDPILDEFAARVRGCAPRPPRVPFVSNLTGTWITESEATDPGYWSRHLREAVRFADGVATLVGGGETLLVEVGPGRTLSTFARRSPKRAAASAVVGTVRHPEESADDAAYLLAAVARLWTEGVAVDWKGFYRHERRRRVPLPTYPFERKSYWMKLHRQAETASASAPARPRGEYDPAERFFSVSWKRSAPVAAPAASAGAPAGCTLIFEDGLGVGGALGARLAATGGDVAVVRAGSSFAEVEPGVFTVDPRRSEDYDALLDALQAGGREVARVAHLWSVSETNAADLEPRFVEDDQYLGFHSLVFLAQALGRREPQRDVTIAVVSTGLHEVTGGETVSPAKATLLGPVRVIPQEYPNVRCRSVDVAIEPGAASVERIADRLLAELLEEPAGDLVAYRSGHRWVRSLDPVRLDDPEGPAPALRQGGVYLITGGVGGIGLTLAEYLARTCKAKLALTSRTSLPPREEWDSLGPDDPAAEKVRKLREIEALGAEVLVFAADVADPARMAEVIAETEARFGPVNGVVHSAGVPAGGVIQRKTPEAMATILAPKVAGTLALDRALADRDLDFFVLCSSLASIVGGFGQVDYCAANAFMDAFAHRATASGRRAVSVNWDAWKEVGMAAASERRPGRSANAANAANAGEQVAHPLLQRRFVEGDDVVSYVATFDADALWVLSDHKVTGTPTLPGTGYLEIARAAFAAFAERTGADSVEIRDLVFLAPLTVPEGERREVRTVLRRQGDGFAFSVSSRSSGEGESWRQHAAGTLLPLEGVEVARYDVDSVAAECAMRDVTITDAERASQRGFLDFGPRWNVMRRGRFAEDRGLATLALPEEFASDVSTFRLHPALMDAATGFLSILAMKSGPFLPFTYGSIRIKGPLPASVSSYARFSPKNNPEGGTLELDVSVLDDDGREIVEIHGYILRKIDVAAPVAAAVDAAPAENYNLVVRSPGLLESLEYAPSTRTAPGPHEIEIEVQATGLNFKEVLIALGMMPVPQGAEGGFGLECAGRVTALGEGVTNCAVGDDVISFARPSFSPYVTTAALYTARRPAGMTPVEAATIPVAFLTAYYSLVTLGRLQRGERVLVQAAAGGVGLAAIQVAQWIGAEIFATAGSDEKRDFLRSLGVEHVMDSRSLAFAGETMRLTGGAGVDVVLNSLGGEFIAKGLEVLAPYGRFLEIGKRDIYADAQLGLRPFERSLSFFAIDIAPRNVPLLTGAWREVVEHFERGDFHPIRHTVFPIDEVDQAFDFMSRAKHIGKVVVSLEDEEAIRRLAAKRSSAPSGWRPATAARAREGAAAGAAAPGAAAASVTAGGLAPAEGADAFNRLLASGLTQVAVSARDVVAILAGGVHLDAAALAGARPDAVGYRPSHARPDLGSEYTAPRNETEATIAGIWQHVLGVEQVGVFDDFYELGGDSLLATQVVARLREAFGFEIAVAKMFDEPTIAGLGEFVEATRWAATSLGAADDDEEERDEGRI